MYSTVAPMYHPSDVLYVQYIRSSGGENGGKLAEWGLLALSPSLTRFLYVVIELDGEQAS